MRPIPRWVLALIAAFSLFAVYTPAQQQGAHRAPRLWTDAALKTWALPVAGVNATPNFYTESEYYAAPVSDELRTYPVYVKDREPPGYRERLLAAGSQPLIETGRSRTDAEWAALGRDIFEGFDLEENRTDDPRVFAWLDDPANATSQQALVTKDGIIVSLRWIVDRDRKLKLTLGECGACHTRVLKDGTSIVGAQGNLNFNLSIFPIVFEHAAATRKAEGRFLPPNQELYREWGVPWLADDVNARLKTMSEAESGQLFVASTATPGTFPRVHGSPWFTNRMPDLIGVKDRRYLDATGTHRNRSAEDIARYAILVTDADDGSVGPHTFVSDEARRIRRRHSDDAMYAIGRFVYALEPPANPNKPDAQSARGEQVFTRSGCRSCHTPPLYTNNKLVPVDGFSRLDHPLSPPAADVMIGTRIGVDPGLALRTRKGTGYYKVPSLRGLWYRDTLEHSGSMQSLEEWFDSARLAADYRPKGFNPPDVKTRPVPGHLFGLNLPAEDKRALLAFLRTL
jgi:hypothetical protein